MEGFLGIGGTELAIILLFAFLIFGPDKLPDIARVIGKGIAKFRDAQNEVNEVIRQEVFDPNDPDGKKKAAREQHEAEMREKYQNKGTESFAERKARYDEIRAARKAKEDAAHEAAEGKGDDSAAASSNGSDPAAGTPAAAEGASSTEGEASAAAEPAAAEPAAAKPAAAAADTPAASKPAAAAEPAAAADTPAAGAPAASAEATKPEKPEGGDA